jgi:hypothetical protein
VVIGYVSVRSQGGTSFLDAEDLSDPEPFYGTETHHAAAAEAIERACLEVVAESRLGRRWRDRQPPSRNSRAAR